MPLPTFVSCPSDYLFRSASSAFCQVRLKEKGNPIDVTASRLNDEFLAEWFPQPSDAHCVTCQQGPRDDHVVLADSTRKFYDKVVVRGNQSEYFTGNTIAELNRKTDGHAYSYRPYAVSTHLNGWSTKEGKQTRFGLHIHPDGFGDWSRHNLGETEWGVTVVFKRFDGDVKAVSKPAASGAAMALSTEAEEPSHKA